MDIVQKGNFFPKTNSGGFTRIIKLLSTLETKPPFFFRNDYLVMTIHIEGNKT